QLNTFSIGFKDQAFYDETRFALQVAERYKTNHHAFVLTTQDLYEQLYPAIDYLDEPFADSSALAVYILSQQTAQKVKVALSGDGADELLAGYNKHIAAYRFQHPKMLERIVGLLQPIWQKLPQNRHSFGGNKVRQLDKFAQMSQFSPAERYWRMAVWNQPEQVQELMQLPHNFWQKGAATYTNNMNGKTLNETLLTDFRLVLQGDMLQKVDSMSMANSLEVRTPFLDYTVVDFVFSLPDYYKISTQRSKRLLVDSFKHLLPTDVYNRPKHGFEVPLAQWFRAELHQTIHQNLLQKDFIKQQGLFNPIFVERLLQKLQTNNMGDTPVHIWALLVFQNWWKRYFSDSYSI
ncbi:MAG TPA: asparagine synthase C-terminal domain-containing protein, partial [Chitinophagales bacterium]|nr:asparagine synthase C-terminal domain-containing protein [Chitinophagales bacterium]